MQTKGTAVVELLDYLTRKGVTIDTETKKAFIMLERAQILLAYMGYFDPDIPDADFEVLRQEAEIYYDNTFGTSTLKVD